MSRLADPSICPDCRGQVSDQAVCTACGLALTGPLATELWRTMLSADSLVERLRSQAPAPVPTSAPAPVPAPFPAPAPSARPATTTGLSGKAVPVLLLALGALCVFVAVGLFLAVTWQVLPLGVKATLMVAVTAAFATGATVLSRRGLRGSTEAIWALTAGLLALDVSAAHRAGLAGLDLLSGRGTATLTGVLLGLLGLAAAALAVRHPVRRSLAAQTVLLLGLLVVVLTQVWAGPWSDGPAEAVAVPLLVAAAYVVRLVGLRQAAYAVVALAGLVWVTLVVAGAEPALEVATRGAFWAGFDGWPLAVAAAYAAVAASLGRLPMVVRVGSSAATFGCLALLALLPGSWTTTEVLVVAAIVAGLAAVVRLSPTVWAVGAGLVGALGVGLGALAVVLVPFLRVTDFLDEPRALAPARTTLPPVDGPALWTVVALVVTSLVLVGAARRFVPALSVAVEPPVVLSTVALAVATGVAGQQLPVWAVAAGFALAAVASVVAVASDRSALLARAAALVVAAYAAVLALATASDADTVGTIVAAVLSLSTVAVLTVVRRDRDAVPPALAGAAVLLLGYAADAGALAAGDRVGVTTYATAAVACLGLLAARAVTADVRQRLAAELSAAVVAVGSLVLALDDATVMAVGITVVGTTVALVSVIHRDRVHLGWLASVVLAASTGVRLALDTRLAPEIYNLPAAAVLIGAGVARLLREPRLSTWRVLGSGLSLALLPSLLIALDDPSSHRTVLVGTAALVAVAVGVERRWQAPFLVGVAVLGALALRFLLPVAMDILADPLGAWILFGVVGALCLTGGILWERSLANLRLASRYVAALR